MAEVEEYLNSGDYEMSKPAYTKEMHERGEKPKVGMKFLMGPLEGCNRYYEFVGKECFVIGVAESEEGLAISFSNSILGLGCMVKHKQWMKPIPIIEDEFVDYVRESVKNLNTEYLSLAILNKYNITPKETNE